MTDLHSEIQGGGETLVLLRSGGTDSRDWQFIAPPLSQDFRVVTYDARGMGQSPIPIEPTDHLADFTKLLDALDLTKTILAGHSMGGQIAADFTLKYPERVEKLVLIAPGLTGYQFGTAYQQMFKNVWAVVPEAGKMLDIMLMTPKAYAMSESMRSPQRGLIERVHRENIEKSLGWKNLEQIWTTEPPIIERLSEIKTETLLLVGTKDSSEVLKIAEFDRQLPNVEFKQIENADHGLTWTHPKQIVDAVRSFLR